MKKSILLLLLFFTLTGIRNVHAQDAYLGEIRLFAGNYAPVNWLKCEGQLLPINQYTALFALLGTTYGGNGTTTFALPDLRGRVPMGAGAGTSLTNTVLGEQKGNETITLTAQNLPSHNHAINIYNGSGNRDSIPDNTATALSLVQNVDLSRSNAYTTAAPNTTLNTATISNTGNNVPVNNMQPSLTLTYIICTQGIFPTHP